VRHHPLIQLLQEEEVRGLPVGVQLQLLQGHHHLLEEQRRESSYITSSNKT
jgi:hypothetical protein